MKEGVRECKRWESRRYRKGGRRKNGMKRSKRKDRRRERAGVNIGGRAVAQGRRVGAPWASRRRIVRLNIGNFAAVLM